MNDALIKDRDCPCKVVNRFDTQLSDLVVLDTLDFQNPVAMIKLPLRVRPGLHGNFVPADEMNDPEAELVDFEWVPAKVSLIVCVGKGRSCIRFSVAD